MTLFFASYHPILVLVAGLLTFVGNAGMGLLFLRLLRVQLPNPWALICASLLGAEGASLGIQFLGMARGAFPSVLILFWAGFTFAGSCIALRSGLPLWPGSLRRPSAMGWLGIASAAAGLGINLVVAVAPSTKIDELNYHMLLPSRIVLESALNFYREPWPGAILPQMIFQISLSPLHALNVPGAGNVVSWCFSLLLSWFAWFLIAEHASGPAYLFLAALSLGLYPVVWHVASGPHAMGDLAVAGAVLACLNRDHLLGRLRPESFGAMMMIFVVSFMSTKVSLIPLGLAILGMTFWILARGTGKIRMNYRSGLLMALIFGIFLGPMIIFTWLKSGSPFGPLFSQVFGGSIYDSAAMDAVLRQTQSVNRYPVGQVIKGTVAGYSPFFWMAIIGLVFTGWIRKPDRLLVAALLLSQTALLIKMLPHDARFYGGLLQACLIGFSQAAAGREHCFGSGRRQWLLTAGVIPWLGIQAFYAAPFFPVAFGFQSQPEFLISRIALFEDCQRLNRLLPSDANILVQSFRPNLVYFPRKVFLDRTDLARFRTPGPVYILLSGENSNPARSLRAAQLGRLVYENHEAVLVAYRTPGRKPQKGPIQVYKWNPP